MKALCRVPLLGVTIAALASSSALEAQRRTIEMAPLADLRFDSISWGHRYDSLAHQMVRYDREARIEYRPETGEYVLSWIGQDGKARRLVQEPPNRVRVIVTGDVEYDAATSLYTYTYTFTNLPSSPQYLQRVLLAADDVRGDQTPDTTWYSRPLTPLLRERLGVEGGWTWSQVFGEVLGIPPGASAGPFRIVSPNPPGVVRVAVAGRAAPGWFEDEDPPEDLLRVMDAAMRNWPAGWTIGPVAAGGIPADPALHLAWLEAQLAVADEQGWLGAGEQARRVRLSLREARASLESGEPARARAMLQRGRADIEAIQDDSLLSEARALLLFHMGRVHQAIR